MATNSQPPRPKYVGQVCETYLLVAGELQDAIEHGDEVTVLYALRQRLRTLLGELKAMTAVGDWGSIGPAWRTWQAVKPTLASLADPESADTMAIIRRAAKLLGGNGADCGADGRKKTSPRKLLPENEDARRLALMLARELPKGEQSRNQIAADFAGGSAKKGASLLRIIRKYPDLKQMVDKADPKKK